MSSVLTQTEISKKLEPVFSRYRVRKAVLFGSYGQNRATDKSDIDLFVDSGLNGLRFVGFLNDVQRAVQKPVDVIDARHIEKNSPVEHEIVRTGVTIYAQ